MVWVFFVVLVLYLEWLSSTVTLSLPYKQSRIWCNENGRSLTLLRDQCFEYPSLVLIVLLVKGLLTSCCMSLVGS